jgi:hypothetical protein
MREVVAGGVGTGNHYGASYRGVPRS